MLKKENKRKKSKRINCKTERKPKRKKIEPETYLWRRGIIQRRHWVTWIRRVVLSVPREAGIISSQFVVIFR
jgi:hypothetical protein